MNREAKNDKRPPKKWWTKMKKKIKEGNPSYSEDQVGNTIGDIWYHKLSPGKRKQIQNRDASSRFASLAEDLEMLSFLLTRE